MKRLLLSLIVVSASLYVALFHSINQAYRGHLLLKTDNKRQAGGGRRMNVMFIMADDMRPDLGIYSSVDQLGPADRLRMVTPNFDELARRSIVFRRAYAQYSLCGPSRTSVLTGRRPDTTRVFGNFHYWRLAGGNFTTLPQYFKDNGYLTLAAGKVFHPSAASSNDSDPVSWSEPVYSRCEDWRFEDRSRWPGWNAVKQRQRKGARLVDEYAVDYIIRRLASLAGKARTGERPIFVALGFRKPHLALTCPEKYFRLYPEDTKAGRGDEVGGTSVIQDNATVARDKLQISPEDLRKLRRAYSACISYVDDLLGQILKALDRFGLSNNTVVTFMADHGFHLGENSHFGKYTALEASNHIPMMISVPGRTTDRGMQSTSLVEAIDMFPTVVEAAGLPAIPNCRVVPPGERLCTEGTSLLGLIESTDRAVRDSALSQILRRQGMQYSLRTNNYRYTEFAHVRHSPDGKGSFTVTASWDPPGLWTELYDHLTDPEEKFNKTSDPEYAEIKQQLISELRRRVTTVHGVPTVLPAPKNVDFQVLVD